MDRHLTDAASADAPYSGGPPASASALMSDGAKGSPGDRRSADARRADPMAEPPPDHPRPAGRPSEEGYHYAVMRRAIARLDAEGRTPPLAEIAAEMNMSPAHFQRLFSRWVGVSPKRYAQWLSLGHARTLLRERFSTLEAAGAVGLSGGARLHDLFVRWEAMSPGQYASRGAGLTIGWDWIDSPFGPALAMATDRGLCGLGFAAEMGAEAAMDDLRARWPAATFRADRGRVAALAAAAFAPRGRTPVHVMGGPFQIQVWEALLAIPGGHVTTYGEIARALGRAGAARAVGAAVGRNPLSWLIPCHRAIASSGRLQGYHWGVPVKRAMLAAETAELEGAGGAA